MKLIIMKYKKEEIRKKIGQLARMNKKFKILIMIQANYHLSNRYQEKYEYTINNSKMIFPNLGIYEEVNIIQILCNFILKVDNTQSDHSQVVDVIVVYSNITKNVIFSGYFHFHFHLKLKFMIVSDLFLFQLIY